MHSFRSPKKESRPQRGRAAVRLALADPLRMYLLMVIERHTPLFTALREELPVDYAAADLEADLDILRDAGLVEIVSQAVKGTPRYGARLDLLLDCAQDLIGDEIEGRSSRQAGGAEKQLAASVIGPGEVDRLLAHPVRRRVLRALHEHRASGTVRELIGYERLSREASSRINYHARVLAAAGMVEIVDELPAYRSLVAGDAAICQLLRDTTEQDEGVSR